MSVTINITDPASTPVEELQAVITLLQRFTPISDELGTEAILEAGAGVGVEEEAAVASLLPGEVSQEQMGAEGFHTGGPFPGMGSALLNAAAAAFGATVAEQPPTLVPPPPPTEMPVFALAPSSPPPVGSAAVDLDKDNLPWDGRVHASTKTKTVEGVWKKKRGLGPAEYDRVVAELRTTMMAPAPAHAASATPSHELASAAVPTPPAPAATVPAPPPPPAATGITFAEFMGHVTAGVTSARFTREDVTAACVAQGVPNLPGLINRTDLIPAVARELGLMV